jgi:DNA-binding MarR family transcriptional regulator
MNRSRRHQRIERLGAQLGRELSTHTIMFHQTVADCLGVAPTDHKCLGFIADADHPVTAGELATLTGLTTGAITGVLDRLESAGLAARERDPRDRRRVVVTAAATARDRVWPLFEGVARASAKLAARYSDQELEVIERYVIDSIEMMKEETRRLREAQAAQLSSSNSSSSGGPSRVDGRKASR